MTPGLVSVIIPVFNRAAMLREAVGSVEAQTYRPIELILVDDGSTDETAVLCDRLASEKPDLVRTVHRENGGPGAARETGRVLARGEFLQYLDSDDWIHPEKVERQVRALRENPEAGLCLCQTWEGEIGRPLPVGAASSAKKPPGTIFPSILTKRLWQTVTPLWRRSLTDAIGPWEPLGQEEDREYDARAGVLGARPVFVPEYLGAYLHHGDARLGAAWVSDRRRFRERLQALKLIYRYARKAGCAPEMPEMKRYARELFLVARQAGAAGLCSESEELFRIAREASGLRGRGFDFQMYRIAASMFGWRAAGAFACFTDRFRRFRKAT